MSRSPAFLFVGESSDDRGIFRRTASGLGVASLESAAADALGPMADHPIAGIILGDDVDDRIAAELIGRARRVDPRVAIVLLSRTPRARDLFAFAYRATACLDRSTLSTTLRSAMSAILRAKHPALFEPELEITEVEDEAALIPESEPVADAVPHADAIVHDAADILIVDDDPQLLRMMDRALREIGYQTRTAASPTLAMELLRTTRFQLLVLDVSMPSVTGIELAGAVRRGELGTANADVSMIFVTADDRSVTYEGTFEVSALRCLIKPFDSGRLCRTVASFLDHAA